MKNKLTKLIGIAHVFAGVWLLGGCSEDYDYTTDYSSYDGLTISITSLEGDTLFIHSLNQHAVLIETSREEVEIDKNGYIYSLSDELIAEISTDGVITPLKPGVTDLTVRFRGNHDIATTCVVKVNPIWVTDIIVPQDPLVMKETQTDDLSKLIVIMPGNASFPELTYESEDPTVVTVDANGIVTAVGAGTTHIRIATTDGSGIVKSFAVEVLAEIKVSTLELYAALDGATIGRGEELILDAFMTVLPANADNLALAYAISQGEGSVVTLTDGVLKAVGAGVAKISVTTTDGSDLKKEFTLNVEDTDSKLSRQLWRIGVSITYADGQNYTPDGSTGMPEHLFDGDNATYFSITKPGKSYNGHTTPGDHELYFYLDLGGEQEFNYFKWRHRQNNSSAMFRAWEVSLYGSNDQENYTPIQTNIEIPGAPAGGNTTIEPDNIQIPASKYRYVKVVFNKYNKSSGSNIGVAEMWLGKQ